MQQRLEQTVRMHRLIKEKFYTSENALRKQTHTRQGNELSAPVQLWN